MILDFKQKIPISLRDLDWDRELAHSYLVRYHGRTYKFARAIFGSWYCSIQDCKFCFLSTQKNTKIFYSKRRIESIIAEAILMKELNADLENFTGGVLGNDYNELIKITKLLSIIWGEKIWINLSSIPLKIWDEIKDYIKGLIVSTETFNERLHKFVAPSKPLKLVEKIYNFLDSEKKLKGATLIIGMGENFKDLEITNEFLSRWGVNQLNLYALKPIKKTIYENRYSPNLMYFLYWLSQLRLENRGLVISASKSVRYMNEYPFFYKSGANYYSKLTFFNYFNTKTFIDFEEACKDLEVPNKTIMSLNKEEFSQFSEKVINYDLEKLENKVNFELNKDLIKDKIKHYLRVMERNAKY